MRGVDLWPQDWIGIHRNGYQHFQSRDVKLTNTDYSICNKNVKYEFKKLNKFK